jgi:hypothetical protein
MLRPLLLISSMLLIGPLLVVAGAAIVRRIVPMMSLPTALVLSQAAIILSAMALAPTDLFIPNIPFDDLYVAYFYVPGPHIYMLALLISGAVLKLTSSGVLHTLPYHLASIVAIVVLPGIVGLIIGTFQWFLLGLAWQRWRRAA